MYPERCSKIVKVPPLSEEAMKALLSKPLDAKLATTSPTGDVRISPLWFVADGDRIMMNTFENSEAVKNLKRNPKASLLIDFREKVGFGIHYWGTATIEGPDNDASGMGKMFARYVGDEKAGTEYAQTLIGWGKRVYIRFRPDRNVAWDFREG